MRVTQRQVTLALLGLLTVFTLSAIVIELSVGIMGGPLIATLLGFLAFAGLLGAYWRGWEYARHLTLALLVLLVGFASIEPFVTTQFTLTVFIAPVLALILAGPAWIVGCAIAPILILLYRAGGQGIYAEPLSLAIYGMIIGGLVLARLVTDTAQRNTEAQTRRAEQALASSEAQATELAQQAGELARQNEEQGRLIDLVATLETPAVSLAEGVLLAPVVGHLDSRRVTILTDRLLREVSEIRARLVILDIAGVPAVDTGVAQSLLRAVQAVRLLGCEVTITGISASIAATLTQLGVSLTGVHIARTPQEALEYAVAKVVTNGARRN